MWRDPVTDWRATDTYDIEDALTRVEGNLHEIICVNDSIALHDEKLTWSKTDFPTRAELQRINGNIRSVLAVIPITSIPPPPDEIGESFDNESANAWELNLEWLWRKVNQRSALMESEGALVRDIVQSYIVTPDGADGETYTSSHTGSVIDWFIGQIIAWNNGGLEYGRCVLIGSDEYVVRDSIGTYLILRNDDVTTETYSSVYTGTEIDQFIGQIEEWNNGGL